MPVKVRKTFWKVHPFSDAILREKKNHRQAERAQTLSPNPPPWRSAFPLDQQGMLYLTIHQPELKLRGHQCSQNSHSHIGELENTSQCCSSYTYTGRGKEAQARWKSRNSGEEKLGKLEFWVVFVVFFFNPRGMLWERISSLFPILPHNLPALYLQVNPDCS